MVAGGRGQAARVHIWKGAWNTKGPGEVPRGLTFISGDDLLSHVVSNAVPSALEGLTSVFGMGTGVTPPLQSPESPTGRLPQCRAPSYIPDNDVPLWAISKRVNFMVKPHDRLVLVSFTRCRASTPSLLPGGLPGVFSLPKEEGYLISRWVSRLYAFSVYPVRT